MAENPQRQSLNRLPGRVLAVLLPLISVCYPLLWYWGRERGLFGWLALAMESRRLRAHRDDLARGSALRRHSYRARGNYAGQLAVLHRHFPQEQILLLRTDELERDPSGTVARACAFLGLAPPPAARAYERVFPGDYPRHLSDGWRRRLLRYWWRRELAAQERIGLRWRQ